MAIDPTGSWLLTLSSDLHMTIVPARSILDPAAAVDQLWTLDDVTEIHLQHRIIGRVDCLTWWKTMCGDNVAILGTKVGFLVFIDLVQQTELLRLDLNEHIVNIQVLHSDSFTSTYALVSTKSGSHWFLSLEEKLDIDLSVIQETCYFSIQDQYRTIYTRREGSEREGDVTSSRFQPRRSSQFPPHVQLMTQYARGRHFIAAHDLSNSSYQIYSSEMEQSPLFVYKLPLEADEVLYTDKLMFASHSQGGATLHVIANQLSEVLGKERQTPSDVSVVQSFHLDPGESIQCINRNCFPFYWHSKQEVTSEPCDVQIRFHSVFDGCLVVSSRAVYECRPRTSPERLFVRMCMGNARLARLESLSLLVGLDVCQLTLQVAQVKLRNGEKVYAEKLLQWAKVSPLQRCLLYAEYGQTVAALSLCESLLEGHSGQPPLTTEDKQQVIMVYIQLLVANSLKSRHKQEAGKVKDKLTELLIQERRLLPRGIWQTLCESALDDVAWEVARSAGELGNLVDLYTQKRKLHVENFSDTALKDGAAAYWSNASLFHGSLLDHLTHADLIHLLESHPDLLSHLLDLVEDGLNDLDQNELLRVIQVLDPSQKPLRWCLHQFMKYREKLDPSLSDRLVDMVMLFILSVLHLHKQSHDQHVITTSEQVSQVSQSAQEVVNTRPALMSCSLHRTLIVMKNRLWGWGRAQHFGGPEAELEEVCFRGVKNISVISVSCGYRHVLALTTLGVFSWGSNMFGQLGHSDSLSHSDAVRVARLRGEHVVEVSCGQYHSLALTEDGRVFSWGWGIHGQLGHGNPDNVSVPKEILALKGHMVVTVRGGQGHSVVLTRKGLVYAFGCNAFGQLGVGDTLKRSLPVRVRIEQPVHLIDTHYFHTVAITTKNSIYQWGLSPLGLKQKLINAKKSRGLVATSGGQASNHQFPRLGPSRNIKEAIVQVACGADMTVVATVTGELYSWGRNNEGQLGIGKVIMKEQFPVPISSIDGVCVQQVACGPDFVLALDNTGRLWGWGRNDQGQLWRPQAGSTLKPEWCIVPVRLPLQMEPPKLSQKQWTTKQMTTDRMKLEGLSLMDGTAALPAKHLECYLEALSPLLNEHLLLRKSVQLSSHQCSAAICEHMSKHTEAFSHRLKALESCDLKGAEFVEVMSQMLGNTFRAIETQTGDKQYHLQSVLEQLLLFWGERHTDILERVLSEHLLQIVAALVIVIDRQSVGRSVSVSFSPQFMMRLSLTLTSQLETGALTPGSMLSGLRSHLASGGKTRTERGMSGEIIRERLWWKCVERLTGVRQNTEKVRQTIEQVRQSAENVRHNLQQSTDDEMQNTEDIRQSTENVSGDIEGLNIKNRKNEETVREATKDVVVIEDVTDNVSAQMSSENVKNVNKNGDQRNYIEDTINANIKDSAGNTDDQRFKSFSSDYLNSEEEGLLFNCGHEVTRSEFKATLQNENFGIGESTAARVLRSENQSMSRLDTSQVVLSYYRGQGGGKLACPSCLYRVIQKQSHKYA